MRSAFILLALILLFSQSANPQTDGASELTVDPSSVPTPPTKQVQNPVPKGIQSATINPIDYLGNTVLVTENDSLQLIDRENNERWRCSTNGNCILDVSVDGAGLIYLAVADGLIFILDRSGKEVWSHFMNGSANYTQIKPYRNGFLVVLSMQAYRDKEIAVKGAEGATISDLIEYWSEKRMIWRKDFPTGARLVVNDKKAIVVLTAATGVSLTEIR